MDDNGHGEQGLRRGEQGLRRGERLQTLTAGVPAGIDAGGHLPVTQWQGNVGGFELCLFAARFPRNVKSGVAVWVKRFIRSFVHSFIRQIDMWCWRGGGLKDCPAVDVNVAVPGARPRLPLSFVVETRLDRDGVLSRVRIRQARVDLPRGTNP